MTELVFKPRSGSKALLRPPCPLRGTRAIVNLLPRGLCEQEGGWAVCVEGHGPGPALSIKITRFFPGLICESEAKGDWRCLDLQSDPYFVWNQGLFVWFFLPCSGGGGVF